MRYVLVFLFTFMLLFPLYWMFTGSFQNVFGVMKIPPNWIPKNLTVKNYVYLFEKNPILYPWMFNTFAILGIKTAITMFLVSSAGYVFSVFDFRFKEAIFMVFIFGILIPPGVLLIPTYLTVRYLGIAGTWWGYLLPGAMMPVGIYLFRNYVDTIPKELYESARIDGAGEFKILFRIMLPLCKPALGVIGILVAMNTLQEYIWGLLMLTDVHKQTLMVGLINAVRKYTAISGAEIINPIGFSLASGVILFVPMFLVFLFCQRYFIQGLTLGGIK